MNKNELTKVNENEISKVYDKHLDALLKPLSKEIHLFDTFVAGTLYIEDKSIFQKLNQNDKLPLIRERSKFNENTINVYTEDKVKLGYIPEKDSEIFARLMDAGKLLIARINTMKSSNDFTTISIGIYLIDY